MRAGIRSHLLVRRAQSIGKRFMDGKSLNNKEQGKNLIHKLLLENRLKIIEID